MSKTKFIVPIVIDLLQPIFNVRASSPTSGSFFSDAVQDKILRIARLILFTTVLGALVLLSMFIVGEHINRLLAGRNMARIMSISLALVVAFAGLFSLFKVFQFRPSTKNKEAKKKAHKMQRQKLLLAFIDGLRQGLDQSDHSLPKEMANQQKRDQRLVSKSS